MVMPPMPPQGAPPPPAAAPPPPPPQPPDIQPPEPPSPEEQLIKVLSSMAQADDGELKEILSQFDAKTIKLLKDAANELGADDPDMADLAERIVYLQAELKSPGPKYPDDYPLGFVKPAKPTVAVVSGLARADQAEYVDYRTRVQRTREWLSMRRRGVFSSNNKKRDEPFQSPILLNEFQMRANIVARAETNVDMPPLHPSVREQAQQVEDFGYWALERIQEQHVERLNGPLFIDEAKYADSSGMIVYRCLMNPQNGKFPWKIELIDPITVFPVAGGDLGLLRVTRLYQTQMSKAIDAFDRDGKLANKLMAKGPDGKQPKMSDTVEVIEYYDRWWMVVLVGGIQAIAGEHRYGYVPFVIQPNGHGMPLSIVAATTSGPSLFNSQDASVEVANWFHWAAGSLDADIKTHEQFEAVMGKYASAIRRSDNPPWKRKVSPLAKDKGGQPRELHDGAVNPELMDQDEWEPMIVGPNPTMAQPLLAAMARSDTTGLLSDTRYGAGQANISGNAIAGLNSGDNDKLYATMKCCELARQRLLRMMLRQLHDWGDLLGEEGKRGKLLVPYQPHRRDKDAVAFEITSETVKAVGTDIKVELRADEMQDLLPKINAANLGIQANILSHRRAIDLIGERDPQAMIDEIIEENALMDPRVRDMFILATLLKQAGLEDHIPPEMWAQIWAKNFIGQQSQGQPQGGGPPPPGGGGAPMPQPGVNTSAVNLQPLGMGQQGPTGRPPMPVAPGGAVPPGPPIPGLGPGGIGA